LAATATPAAEDSNNKDNKKETEKEIKGAKEGGIPGLNPPKLIDLPDEILTPDQIVEKRRLQSEAGEGPYGDFTQAREEQVKGKLDKQSTQALSHLAEISAQAGRDLAYYAGMTSFDFEMDDGRIEKYYRVAPTDYEWDELEDLRAEVEGGESVSESEMIQCPHCKNMLESPNGIKLSRRMMRIKTRLLEQKKAEYYLRHAKTHKRMMPEEKAHIANSTRLGAILDALVVTSLHKAVVGKK
jgi:hypothetical protein